MIQKYLSFNYTLSFIYICVIINFQHIWIYFCCLIFKHFHWSIHTYWNIHAYHTWPDNKCTGQMNCHHEHIQTKKTPTILFCAFWFPHILIFLFIFPCLPPGLSWFFSFCFISLHFSYHSHIDFSQYWFEIICSVFFIVLIISDILIC